MTNYKIICVQCNQTLEIKIDEQTPDYVSCSQCSKMYSLDEFVANKNIIEDDDGDLETIVNCSQENFFQIKNIINVAETVQPKSDQAPSKTVDIFGSPSSRNQKKSTKFFHYEILSVLGSGDISKTYLAIDEKTGDKVALKIMQYKYHPFADELSTFHKLKHSNIIKIRNWGTHDNRFYIAMEYIEGCLLSKVLEKQSLKIEYALKIIIQLLDALIFYGCSYIMHKRINAYCIMIDSTTNNLKLLDWKIIWKIIDKNTESIMGSHLIYCMSPEQFKDAKHIDTRSDIYSVGATLFHALCGKLPFYEHGKKIHKIVRAKINNEYERIQEIIPDLPNELANIVEKAMAHETQDRYQNAKEMKEALSNFYNKSVGNKEVTIVDNLSQEQHNQIKSIINQDQNHTKAKKNAKFGKFEILSSLPQSELGKVYLAQHENSKHKVALRILTEDWSIPTNISLIANTKHPNIVEFKNWGKEGNRTYIATEYISGHKLSDLFSQKSSHILYAIRIIAQLLEALRHIENYNTSHRNIRPSNLIITSDKIVKLADLELWQVFETPNKQYIQKNILYSEKVFYDSPESIKNKMFANIHSDIYSVGATLFYILCGKPPFSEYGKKILEIIRAKINNKYQRIQEIIPNIPNTLANIVEKAMAHKPQDRYQSAQEMKQALLKFYSTLDNVKKINDNENRSQENFFKVKSTINTAEKNTTQNSEPQKTISFGPFKILATITSGFRTKVYISEYQQKKVVLKIWRHSNKKFLEFFKQEVRKLYQARHPNIVEIVDWGSQNGHPYIAMKHINGLTITNIISRQPMKMRHALQIAIQLLESLIFIEKCDIVHKHINPSNIIICKQTKQVKLIGFRWEVNLADYLSEQQTQDVYYMPLEQLKKINDQKNFIVYAVGAILYHALSGNAPFSEHGKKIHRVVSAKINNKCESISRQMPQIPNDLANIIEKSMAHEPQDRYQNAEEMKQAILAFYATIKS